MTDDRSIIDLYVRINPEDAVRSGSARAGLHRLEATTDWLQGLDHRLREKLAKLQPFTADKALQDSKLLVTPWTLDDITTYLQHRVELDDQRARAEQEKQAEKDADALQGIREWLKKPDDKRLHEQYGSCEWKVQGPISNYAPIKDFDRLRPLDAELLGRYDDEVELLEGKARERTEQSKAARARYEAEQEAKKEAKKQEEALVKELYEQQRTDWIEQYGSERLKALLAEGIGLDKTYRNERIEKEWAGFEWYDEICGGLRKVANAALQDIEQLRRLRELYPDNDVKLEWLSDSQHIDGCCHEPDEFGEPGKTFRPGPVLTARFLGTTIVRRMDDE